MSDSEASVGASKVERPPVEPLSRSTSQAEVCMSYVLLIRLSPNHLPTPPPTPFSWKLIMTF